MPKSKSRRKKTPKRVLALPDLEQTRIYPRRFARGSFDSCCGSPHLPATRPSRLQRRPLTPYDLVAVQAASGPAGRV
jgi:hypothetical protein